MGLTSFAGHNGTAGGHRQNRSCCARAVLAEVRRAKRRHPKHRMTASLDRPAHLGLVAAEGLRTQRILPSGSAPRTALPSSPCHRWLDEQIVRTLRVRERPADAQTGQCGFSVPRCLPDSAAEAPKACQSFVRARSPCPIRRFALDFPGTAMPGQSLSPVKRKGDSEHTCPNDPPFRDIFDVVIRLPLSRDPAILRNLTHTLCPRPNPQIALLGASSLEKCPRVRRDYA